MQRLVKECPYYCSTYTLTYPKHLNMTGRFNSLFGIDKELPGTSGKNSRLHKRRNKSISYQLEVKQMKITAGLGSIDEYIRFAEAGARRIFQRLCTIFGRRNTAQ